MSSPQMSVVDKGLPLDTGNALIIKKNVNTNIRQHQSPYSRTSYDISWSSDWARWPTIYRNLYENTDPWMHLFRCYTNCIVLRAQYFF